MIHPIAMPKPGQFTEECTVAKWHKKEGDRVAKGEALFEYESDKSAMEYESFAAGVLLKIYVGEGETVPVQTIVAYVGEPGEAVPAVPPPPPPPDKAPEAAPAAVAPPGAGPAPAPAAAPAAAASAAAAPPSRPGRLRISPRARRLARESAIDPSPVRGTGPGGRIVEKDVRDYLAAKGYDRLSVTPAAKDLAVAEGIDLLGVEGTGEGGKITVGDIRDAIAERPRPASRMRQVIAERLVRSVTTAPHFFVTVAVDMTDLLAWREEAKRAGAPYGVNDLVLDAVTRSLTEFPDFNASTDGRTVRRFRRVNLGVAVDREGGLVVPVIRRADAMTLRERHEVARALVEKAREGKLSPDEMAGGTFTVSNMGMLNVEAFTAIINPGETGILAVSSILPQAVVRDGAVAVRSIMRITLSADHRMVDGATAARFANAIRAKLEDTESWKRSM